MSGSATWKVELASDAGQLAPVRTEMRAWLAENGWEEARVAELVLALDEALTNVIRHGYGGAPGGRIVITGEVIEDRRAGAGVQVCVRDFGRQVDPGKICGRDLDDVRPGGLGVHIMRAMTNSVEYECVEGGGMRLTMRKFKTHSAEQSAPHRGKR